MGESWDQHLEAHFISVDEPSACAACLANKDSCEMYAAAPITGEVGWSKCYAEPQERPIMQEDGNEKPVHIVELDCLKDSLTRDLRKDGPSLNGLWIGGIKYKVVIKGEEDAGDHKVEWIHACAEGKKGVHIFVTSSQVLCAFYDENAENPTTGGNCKKQAIEFVKWLCDEGL